ncbi:alpha-(1,3)-fucosyltransferase C [Drosophila sulfurigaster albostrigata]|uniref:alpha-(1,3)-fucosyltransferase C n=1 Tax=Drosophila sulfurigaster albostrigata TaxID=89887 RepID=UPI002D21EB9E|nr:alpha-(1,3)-fucosyltransferase C [Drosophila sulfurigaster albostrigata]
MRPHSRWNLALLVLGFILFGLLIAVYKISTSPLLNQYGILRDYLDTNRAPNEAAATRSILLWSDFFGDARWSLPADTLGPDDFRHELGCEVYQCELSNRHDYLPTLAEYDAIVYHVAQPFPLLQSLPTQRHPHQTYVFALMEPPGETKHRLSDEHNFYNLTMSYRLDSDIVWPYAYMMDVETGARVAPTLQPHWRQVPALGSHGNDSEVLELWPQKLKMAAWFVSHCETLSKREELAAALQQHIDVDIYGKCGTLSCARGDPHCEEMLDTDYMFYLAFENSLCVDYVTEKLYSAMQRRIVPVVFGGANYTRFLPPHSYIDANRFESVEQLASHLRYVANDVNEYMSYFWWRQHYQLVQHSPFCDLCAQLHRPGAQHRTQFYGDIEAWWFNSCRFQSHIRF